MTAAPRINGPGRPRLASCPNGHPYTPDNTYTRPNGVRRCRTCTRIRERGEVPASQQRDIAYSDDPPVLALAAAITRQACEDFLRDPDDEACIDYLSACGLIRENGRLHPRLAAWRAR